MDFCLLVLQKSNSQRVYKLTTSDTARIQRELARNLNGSSPSIERRDHVGSGLGLRPASFQKPGNAAFDRRLRIDGLIAELLCEFEQQRGLADLSAARSGSDASWSGFTDLSASSWRQWA